MNNLSEKIFKQKRPTSCSPAFGNRRGRGGSKLCYLLPISDECTISAPRKWILQDLIKFMDAGEWDGNENTICEDFAYSTFGDRSVNSGLLDGDDFHAEG